MTGSSVVVIGAGIVGCACAYELARRGADVTLLEYGRTGMQATNAAAGMLCPLAESPGDGPMLQLGMRALREYPGVVNDLQTRAGFEVEYRQNGILKVAFTPEEADVLRRRCAWQRAMGFAVEWLDAALCREVEPRLSSRVAGGLFSSDEGSVSSQLITLALSRAAASCGAAVREGAPVTRFTRRSDRIDGVEAGGERYVCEHVVLAAGARSGQLAARFGVQLPIRPIRGQMIALGGMVTPVRHIVWGPHGYLVPRVNGLVFAGATVEDVGFRRRTTQAGLRRLRTIASALVPQLRSATVHFSWAGLRPATPDCLPMIGRLEWPRNVVVAGGHYRNGILLGPLTGRLVADGIIDGDWSGVPPAFRPDRYVEGKQRVRGAPRPAGDA